MPSHVAAIARASGWGNPGAPASPGVTSSSPTFDRIATPFHAGSPWAAVSCPRRSSSSCRSAASASSASLVSCRQTTSGERSSSQGSRRGTRCLIEFTFQVAIRTRPPYPPRIGRRRRPKAHGAVRVNRTVSRRPGRPGRRDRPSMLPRVPRRLSLTLVVLALLLGLGAGPTLRVERARDTVRSSVSAPCPPAGFSLLDGGHIRMPAGATAGATRLLLAIMSGADGDADDNLKLGAAANRQGIAVLYPTVRAGSIWELNDEMGDADVQTVTGLLDRALAAGTFYAGRVSIVGLSNGAGFANRLACTLPRRFAAIVSVAGGYKALDPCPPQERASFLAIHGSADRIVPFNGKKPDRRGNVPRYAAGWARRDGCSTTPATLHPRHLVTRLVFGGCPAGMRVEVLRLSGTDHGWPGAAAPWPKHNPSGVDADLEVLRWVRHAVRPGG